MIDYQSTINKDPQSVHWSIDIISGKKTTGHHPGKAWLGAFSGLQPQRKSWEEPCDS